MKEDLDKERDAELRILIRDLPLEAPSSDFTHSIMAQIKQESLQRATTYRPLISLRGWIALFLLLGLLAGFSLTLKPEIGVKWLTFPALDTEPAWNFVNKIMGLELSKTLLYAGLALAAAVYIQIYFLKSQFDKSLSKF